MAYICKLCLFTFAIYDSSQPRANLANNVGRDSEFGGAILNLDAMNVITGEFKEGASTVPELGYITKKGHCLAVSGGEFSNELYGVDYRAANPAAAGAWVDGKTDYEMETNVVGLTSYKGGRVLINSTSAGGGAGVDRGSANLGDAIAAAGGDETPNNRLPMRNVLMQNNQNIVGAPAADGDLIRRLVNWFGRRDVVNNFFNNAGGNNIGIGQRLYNNFNHFADIFAPGTLLTNGSYKIGNVNSKTDNIGQYGDPINPVFASLGKIMKSALSVYDRKGKMANTITDESEISSRIKEQAKAHLPIFICMFKSISLKCDLLMGLINMGLNVERVDSTGIGHIGSIKGVNGRVLPHRILDESESKKYYLTLLGRIKNVSDSMINNSHELLSKMNDFPLLMETSTGSIETFRSTYGRYGFMPMSIVSVVGNPAFKVNNNEIDTRLPNLGYPLSNDTDNLYKFNFGTRHVLHGCRSRVSLEHCPYVKQLVTEYNTQVAVSSQLDPKLYDSYVANVMELSRYVFHTKVYGLITGSDIRVTDPANDKGIRTYAQSVPLSSSISEITAKEGHRDMVNFVREYRTEVHGGSGTKERNLSQIYNFIDLNIQPINIYALRREIPLIHILNYSVTFDHFVKEMFITSNNNTNQIGYYNKELMLHPYKMMDINAIDQIVNHFNGHNSGSHAYKFISDQIFNKSLLYSVKDTDPTRTRNSENDFEHADTKLRRYNKNDTNDTEKKEKDVNGLNANEMKTHACLRFNTKFLRNNMFIALAQDLINKKMRMELTAVNSDLVNGLGNANEHLTRYETPAMTYDQAAF